ncbi:MAG: alpha/beta hydrolase, partial [Chloroflexota bacterium]|nr:alpha/beta hydrolase [Chloroflexota bacterium]
GFKPPPIKIALGRAMNQVWPAFIQPSGLDVQALSRDPAVVSRYEQDPLVHDRVSARLFVGFYEAGLWALEHAAEFPVPLLLMHGSDDTLTSPEASRAFAASVGERCTLKVWDGLYHEIHNEPEQEQVFDQIIAWLRQTLGNAS